LTYLYLLFSKRRGKPARIVEKIIDEDFYKSDYNQITGTLLFENAPYIEAITTLRQIIENDNFPER